jgi:hypothetical protein
MSLHSESFLSRFRRPKKVEFTTGLQENKIMTFFYAAYQNDRSPLAIPLKYVSEHKMYTAINLHYLHPEVRKRLIQQLAASGRINFKENTVFLTTEVLRTLFDNMSVCFRSYKTDKVVNPQIISIDTFMKDLWKQPGIMAPGVQQGFWDHSRSAFG